MPEEEAAWRFSIQAAEQKAQRHAFSSIDELVSFLLEELELGEGEGEGNTHA